MEEPILDLLYYQKLFNMEIDASNFGTGDLMQEWHPIAFKFQKLNDA